MLKKSEQKVNYIDFSEKYLDSIVGLADARLGEKYITAEKLKDFIQDKNNACKLVIDADKEQLLGFLFSHGSDIKSLADEFKLTTDEIRQVVGDNEKIYVVKTLVLHENAEKHGLATELARQGLATAKEFGFYSAWSALWVRKDGSIPAKNLIERLGLSFYKTVHMRMYNRPDFKCVDCHDRCTCDSAIYYKIL